MTARPSVARSPALAWADGSLRLAEAVRGQQDQLRRLLERLGDPGLEDVHQGRVAARRLRSMLKTFAPAFDPRWARLYRLDLRSFARALGAVRETDVLAACLDASLTSSPLTATDLRRVATELRVTRSGAREQFARRGRGTAWSGLLGALAARSEQPPRISRADVPLAELLRLTDDAWRKAARRVRRGAADPSSLHEQRLALKHARYALEVVADAAPVEAARLLHRLRRAQDAIGEHRDTVEAGLWVRSRAGKLGARTVERVEGALLARERRQRRAALGAAARTLAAGEAWRAAVRPLRKAKKRYSRSR